MSDLREYYGARAKEYESIYHRDDPVRQAELAALASEMKATIAGRRILEIACGTGYWTAIACEAAEHITATDASPEVLEIARSKELPTGKVLFREGDAYRLSEVPGEFDAGLACFWLSHVPKSRLAEFIEGFHRRLGEGAAVFLADNVYVPGIGGELVTLPNSEDTYKLRRLADGSEHRVIKNYYDEPTLRRILSPLSADLRIHVGECFWWAAALP